MEYQRNRHHIYLVNHHFVWIPKRRKPILIGDVKMRLEEIIRQVAEELKAKILALEIMPDHVHLFISVPPTLAPNDVANKVKGRSSHILREEFPHLLKLPSLWTHNYFVSTAGNVSSETIKEYMETQSRR